MSATPERNMARIAVIARVPTTPFGRHQFHGQEYVADTHVGIIAANHRSSRCAGRAHRAPPLQAVPAPASHRPISSDALPAVS